MVRGGRAEAHVPRSDVSFRLDQKTANFKAANSSRPMQCSALTAEKQKNQLAQTEFRFIKNNITTIRGAITLRSSPLYQRCTAAKDGKLQRGRREQTNAVEFFARRKAKELPCRMIMMEINKVITACLAR